MGLFSKETTLDRTIKQSKQEPLLAIAVFSLAVIAVDSGISLLSIGYKKATGMISASYSAAKKYLEDDKKSKK
jgi:hypothetical protein